MERFEAYLEKATAQGANIVPGAVMAVVDKDCNYIWKETAGYDGVIEDAKPLKFDATFFIASCTKLIASIASLQVVERSLITLDEPIDKYLPGLASQPIVKVNASEITLREASKSITLRQLITHSSGAIYDWISPKMYAWRASRGEGSALVAHGDVAKGYSYPRSFEAGESWEYSGGMDWASLLVERLTSMSFEEYVETNIAKPLGITSFTWHLPRKPAVEEKIMQISARKDDGSFAPAQIPYWPKDPIKEGGEAGMYANVHHYTRVLSDSSTTILFSSRNPLWTRCSPRSSLKAASHSKASSTSPWPIRK